jgi:hypothetical protein
MIFIKKERKMQKKEVIKYFGSVQKMADALGVTRQMIYLYDDILPEMIAYKIEVITNGALRVVGSDYDEIKEEK